MHNEPSLNLRLGKKSTELFIAVLPFARVLHGAFGDYLCVY